MERKISYASGQRPNYLIKCPQSDGVLVVNDKEKELFIRKSKVYSSITVGKNAKITFLSKSINTEEKEEEKERVEGMSIECWGDFVMEDESSLCNLNWFMNESEEASLRVIIGGNLKMGAKAGMDSRYNILPW